MQTESLFPLQLRQRSPGAGLGHLSDWSIEHNLPWVLDVTFREEDSRLRHPTAIRDFALLRTIAINLIGQDRYTHARLRGNRNKAAGDDDYMLQLKANFRS